MRKSHILIHYKPQLYMDLLGKVFRSLGSLEVYELPSLTPENALPEQVDVVVLSLDEEGKPEVNSLPDRLQRAKLLAFSPGGERGYRRLAGEDEWEEIHPFGLDQLIRAVVGSGQADQD